MTTTAAAAAAAPTTTTTTTTPTATATATATATTTTTIFERFLPKTSKVKNIWTKINEILKNKTKINEDIYLTESETTLLDTKKVASKFNDSFINSTKTSKI